MFISLEGMEGSGKSTQRDRLGAWLESLGKSVVLTREPGATALGRGLRAMLLDCRHAAMGDTAELFLFLADRAQHVNEVIRPALEEGQIVLCDRYADSTLVYQGYGRGLSIDDLQHLSDIASGGLLPDLTLLLDLPPQLGLERAGRRNQEHGTVLSEGRFDAESLDFHRRIREGYLDMARRDSSRFVVIDAREDVNQVFAECQKAVTKMVGAHAGKI